MVPSQAILTAIMANFATYIAAQLAAPTWFLRHVKSNFVPGPNLVVGDVTIDPDWTHNATTLTNTMQTGKNPYSQGERTAVYGTFDTEKTTANTGRQVFGWVIQEGGTDAVLASELAPNVATINALNQMLNSPVVGFELPRNAVR